MDDNLPELRDIHLPETEVPFWPLAWGWWLLLTLLLLAVGLFLWRFFGRKHYALRLLGAALSEATPVAAAARMSELLRRVCVYKYPSAVALYGHQWRRFLEEHCRRKLSDKAARLLLYAPYLDAAESYDYDAADLQDLYSFCHRWVGENL